MKTNFWLGLFIIPFMICSAYGQHFTKRDTLRGTLSKERSCYDVKFYELMVDFDFDQKSISGNNKMTFDLKMHSQFLQIDLFENMQISNITLEGKPLEYHRTFDAVFININHLQADKRYTINIQYSGSPIVAVNPPWDGGFIWSKDKNGDAWVNVSCQGIGASLWWPNKDHLSDEPDSMIMHFLVPKGFEAISNGQLLGTMENDEKTLFSWKVSYPINNYNVTFSIGKYVHFSDVYTSPSKDNLSLDYYVMPYNLAKAKEHFSQVLGVLEAFEYYFGPYPFWEDGYALIETPHLGMEHQSAIAYGNQYLRGYLGGSIPQNMNWDYIIVHETGHEYWGNAVSTEDNGELWIHESFTTYMEALYVEYHYGYEESIRYLQTQRNHGNVSPIIGPLNVNWDSYPNSDHYFKGSWFIHTLRSMLDNDELFFSILKTFYENHKYKTTNSEEFFYTFNHMARGDYSFMFDQYLKYSDIPVLEYSIEQEGPHLKIKYRWKADIKNFKMPVKVGKKSSYEIIYPTSKRWKSSLLKNINIKEFQVARELFLIDTVLMK